MFEMSMSPDMGQRVTPALLNLAHLLSLPSLDLEQAVRHELEENPALEEVEAEDTLCPRCGRPLIEGICMRCDIPSTGDDLFGAAPGEETLDPLLFVAAPRSLNEILLDDLYASLPASEHPVALTLIGSLDDQGFLSDDPEDIAASLGVDPRRVAAVLARLREIGPPGIAARDSRECMLAQIDDLASEGVTSLHARAIVDVHMADLAARRYRQIARALGIGTDEVAAARTFIAENLWPYPAQAITPDILGTSRTRYRTPDIAIIIVEDAFVVEVLNSQRRALRLNPLYQELAAHAATLEDAERAHVQEFISRARVFLSNLRQRESTLKRIGEVIVEHQADFLRHGVRHLLPMTRAEIAVELGVHESTVSRATSDKTAQIPSGDLLPVSEFFVSARGVQDVLRELIDCEDKARPLSDQLLCEQLADMGYPIARRTVAKYRDLMKIPAAQLRGA
ncbi:RNA polymerase factor sigma-54 [Chloroflexales bacterium ZM16-3]|nr:RNA polymerase factor sigma-54 [Chloroflexales bacterium ZM16-3]